MRYLLLILLTMVSTSSLANAKEEGQYIDAADSVKALYEIMNKRGMNCDSALDIYGIEAALSERCEPFMNSDDLISKIMSQCSIVSDIVNLHAEQAIEKNSKNTLKTEDIDALKKKSAFSKEYCGSRPPARYTYISKTYKKIQLMKN